MTLLRAMAAAGVRRIVFSSSATVYGDPERVPIAEDARTGPTNPYGRTKLMIEQVLDDLALADAGWSIGILRYFNPVGAHESGLIGEDPRGVPNNLMPFVSQVAVGRLPQLSVFGGDWPTPDGTGVRDYIHVVDLARGHLAALDRVFAASGAFTVNLGTGTGYSVLELVRAFEQASGRKVPYRIVDRRPATSPATPIRRRPRRSSVATPGGACAPRVALARQPAGFRGLSGRLARAEGLGQMRRRADSGGALLATGAPGACPRFAGCPRPSAGVRRNCCASPSDNAASRGTMRASRAGRRSCASRAHKAPVANSAPPPVGPSPAHLPIPSWCSWAPSEVSRRSWAALGAFVSSDPVYAPSATDVE